MRLLVLKEYRSPVNGELSKPETGVNDVLIKVKACGICGSDTHGYHGSAGRLIRALLLSESVACSDMAAARKDDRPLAVEDGA